MMNPVITDTIPASPMYPPTSITTVPISNLQKIPTDTVVTAAKIK